MNRLRELEDKYEAKLQELEGLDKGVKAAKDIIIITEHKIMVAEEELREIDEAIIRERQK